MIDRSEINKIKISFFYDREQMTYDFLFFFLLAILIAAYGACEDDLIFEVNIIHSFLNIHDIVDSIFLFVSDDLKYIRYYYCWEFIYIFHN